jgi:hypothetical protein
VKDGLTSKNVRLGKNYVVDSSQSILKAEGIQCFDEDGMEERRLIVVESKVEPKEEEYELSDDPQIFTICSQKLISHSCSDSLPGLCVVNGSKC